MLQDKQAGEEETGGRGAGPVYIGWGKEGSLRGRRGRGARVG
jgi:hypothetical protein